jgi:hypothetical protein
MRSAYRIARKVSDRDVNSGALDGLEVEVWMLCIRYL